MPFVAAAPPRVLSVPVAPFRSEAGELLAPGALPVWIATAEGDPLTDRRPTVVVFPPMTAGPAVTSYWPALVGEGRLLRPWAHRVLGVPLLGSLHGGGAQAPLHAPRAAAGALVRGAIVPPGPLPAPITPWDQARAAVAALAGLGVPAVDLLVGGSLGGMVALCAGALLGRRAGAVAAIAAPLATGAWTIAQNHLGRAALFADPEFPIARRGLPLARQIARLAYRSPAGLAARCGRDRAVPRHLGPAAAPLAEDVPYRAATYLAHAAERFAEEWPADRGTIPYLRLLGALDHHDLLRRPGDAAPLAESPRTLALGIPSDGYIPAADVAAIAPALAAHGVDARYAPLDSDDGHDGFLLAVPQVAAKVGPLLRATLAGAPW